MKRALALLLIIAFAAPAMADSRADAREAYQRGEAALKVRKVRAAYVEARNAVQADPGWGEAHALQGRVALAMGDGLTAEAELLRARAAGVPPGRLRHLLSHAYILNNKPELALGEAAAAQVPPAFAGYAARMRGRAQAAMGNMAEAGLEFDRAIALARGDSAAWSDLGRYRMLSANQAGAVEAADRAVAIDPGNMEALILKGELARNQYGLVAALPWFERALEIDPVHVPAMLEVAATLGDIGRMSDMLTMTRRVLAVEGRNAQAFYLQAVLAARAGNFVLARGLIQKTGDRMDAVPGAVLLRANLEIRAGSLEQAIARLDRLATNQPGNIKVRRLLGMALEQVGDASGVIAKLQPLADRVDADSYILSLVGRAHEALGERAMAARYLDRAAHPVLGEPLPFGTGETLTALARAAQIDGAAGPRIAFIRGLIAAGEKPRALAEAQALQQLNPGTPAAHILVGDALVALGRFDEAGAAYRLAANISFSEPVALRMIDAFQRAGQMPAALETLRLFLTQNPQNMAGRMLAANYIRERGDWPRAIAILEGLSARLGHRDAVILSDLAQGHLETGKPAKGLPYAAAAYRLMPGNPAITGTFGWLRFKARSGAPGAISLLEKARALAPENAETLLRLAQAYAASGRKADARIAAEGALASADSVKRAEAVGFLRRL